MNDITTKSAGIISLAPKNVSPDSNSFRLGSCILLFGSLLSIFSTVSLELSPGYALFVPNIFLSICAILTYILVYMKRHKGALLIAHASLIFLLYLPLAFAIKFLEAAPHTQGAISLAQEAGAGIYLSITQFAQTHWGWGFAALGVSIQLISLRPAKNADDPDFFDGTSQKNRKFIDVFLIAPKWPLVCGAVLILIGIIVLFSGQSENISLIRKLIGALISELGFAFFIAYVLNISMEIHSKEEHEKQISRGILSYVYGISLDDAMFLSTEKYIFKSPFYRRSVNVKYHFVARKDDRVLIRHTSSYIVENISQDMKEYSISTSVERPDIENLKDLLQGCEYGLHRLFVNGKPIDQKEMQSATKDNRENPNFLVSKHPVQLKPGDSVEVRTVNMTEKYLIDTELWRSLLPCDGVTLEITWDGSIDLEFRADAVHPKGRFDFEHHDTRSLTAAVYGPLFPQNGITFWWRPPQAAPDVTNENLVEKSDMQA